MTSCANWAEKSHRPAPPSRIAAGIRRPLPNRWRLPSPARPPPPPAPPPAEPERVALLRPTPFPADIAATLLYPVTGRPFRELYEMTCGWNDRRRAEVIDAALGSRTGRDEIPR